MAALPTTQRDQLLLAVGILMVIAAGAYWYFVDDPQNTDLKTKVAHIDSLNAQNQRAKAQLARGSVAKIKAEADSMRANLDLLRTLVPAGSEVPALIDQVSNAARRVMQKAGLGEHQIEGVRGFADTRLRQPEDPLDPGNRRISIVVRRG